jgi:hypothetical protein
MYQKRKMTSTP